MTSQHRIQQYMEKHKVTKLFEDLMNKVIHEQPDDPVYYLIKVLCKKAGKEIPSEAKLSHLRRSTSDLPRGPASPELSRKSRPAASAWTTSNMQDRSYERPWLANTKKVRSKKSGESEEPQRPVSAYIKPSLGPTFPPNIRRASLDEFLRIKPISPGRRQKSDWNGDTKYTTTNFDELFDESKGGKSRQLAGTKSGVDNSRRAWATHGLGDGEENLFSSSGYRGPKRRDNGEDPLAGEIITPSFRSDSRETIQSRQASSVSSRVKGPRLDVDKHRKELEKLVMESDRRSTDSGIHDDRDVNTEDDEAIELLEDPEILRREGVKNVPTKGYKLSRTLRQTDPEVKLNINLYTGSGPMPSQAGPGPRYGELSDYVDSEREGSLIGSRYSPVSDEEFESVSQVTGPRHPIWTAPDSDGEAPVPRPPLRSPNKAVTLPYRSNEFETASPWESRMAMTTPLRSTDLYNSQSVDRNEQYRPNTQESVDMYGGPSGGWAVTDGSDVSQTDWKGSKKNRPAQVDYRSY